MIDLADGNPSGRSVVGFDGTRASLVGCENRTFGLVEAQMDNLDLGTGLKVLDLGLGLS
jgi:hypothetical protein